MTIFLRTSKLRCYYMVGLGAPYLEYPNWPDIQTFPSSCIETEICRTKIASNKNYDIYP